MTLLAISDNVVSGGCLVEETDEVSGLSLESGFEYDGEVMSRAGNVYHEYNIEIIH